MQDKITNGTIGHHGRYFYNGLWHSSEEHARIHSEDILNAKVDAAEKKIRRLRTLVVEV